MATYYFYDDVTKWKIYPINGVDLTFTTSDNIHRLRYLEENSYIKFTPILSEINDDNGCPRVVATEIDAQFILLQNNYSDFDALITDIINYQLSWVTIFCAVLDSNVEMTIFFNSNYAVCKTSHTIEFKGDYPLLTISLKGIMKNDKMILMSNLFGEDT